jgi:predicted nucleic acid-binding protein
LIVIDASAVLEWLEGSRTGNMVDRAILAQANPLHAPHLIDVEVAHAVRRRVLLRIMTEVRAKQALWDLANLSCVRHEHYPLLPRIWELRHTLSAYDAVYVSLAEFLDAPLITCDTKLANAPGNRARIKLIS